MKRSGTLILVLTLALVVLLCLPELLAASGQTHLWQGVITGGFHLGSSAVVGLLAVRVLTGLRAASLDSAQAGPYRLEKKLGSGGMGEVYLACHALLRRPTAVKMLRSDRTDSPQAQKRFEREVRAVSELTHPNTISIYDFGRTDKGQFYYAMEYLEGMDLQRLVDRHGALPAERAVFLLDQVLGAVGEAHRRGILHRDIKPSNIFLTERGGELDFVKILDFGLAKEVQPDGALPADLSASGTLPLDLAAGLTLDGSITGTPLYMAPEMFYGDAAPDHRADLYSLGAVAYFLLAGRPVFEAKNAVQALIHHVRAVPVPPRELGVHLSDELQRLLLQALEKDPDLRCQSAEELRAALQATPEWGVWTREHARQWWQEAAPETVVALGDDVLPNAA
jgi:eukaryotic-like serine/threonine-protein kinase